MNALLAPGDEVVVTDPCYPQLFLVAESLRCHFRRLPLRPEQGFRPDVERLCAMIGPATRMVVLNFPHNPTGAHVSPEEQRAIVDACAEVGAYLIWDGAFAEITYDVPPLPDPADLYERAVSMGTLSKTYGLPGLRVGWCLAAPEVLQELIRFRDYITLHLSPLVELIAGRAIEETDLIVGPRREQCRRNRELLHRWCAHQEDLLWTPAQGGSCIFPRLLTVPDVDAFCHRLARERRVMLVPGTCFGHPQHVRLGFGGRTEALLEGLKQLESLLAMCRDEEAFAASRTIA
jgi:aspartate/methionine/tyrosine aminotransferase